MIGNYFLMGLSCPFCIVAANLRPKNYPPFGNTR